ncbi:permease [Gemmatirosa kalamazoonensis]|uniref:Permease n=1 Tax=Gemmatirosa kalamazoonensis TaxID=861299 RepID=W0RCT3_9BACT|nr:ABC transporter permease [Gemmatirosa kalamazoonensis]AHG88232.1 permease [Gemmatirosa kalamazoonensis]
MLLHDLRYAARSLTRARGFTLAVVLTLGLGIGANTAIFSVVRGVLLKPLPHRDGDRLIYLRQSIKGPGGENIAFSVPEINDFRQGAKSLQGVAEYSPLTLTMLRADGTDPVRINVGLVTGNFFQVMGLHTILGRQTNDADDGPKPPPVMVLTYDYWKSHFGGDPKVIGQVVRVEGKPATIVGVAQPAPFFPGRYDALMNMVISEHHVSATMVQGRSHRMTEMIARLAPGVSVEQARTEVATIRRRVQAQFVQDYDPGSGYKVDVLPFREVLGEKARLTLGLLMAAAVFVMIISCANVTNLTLMRGVRREHELVVRAAVGAGTAPLRRLMLAENLLLASAGALLGLVLAFGGVGLLTSFAERYSPRADEIRIDGMVLGFTVAVTLGVALLLSYAPRLPKEGTLGGWVAAGVSRVSGSLRKQRMQRSLVVAQIAVSVVLLAGAGLLTRTMMRLASVDDGLKRGEVLTMEVPLIMGERSDADSRALYQRISDEVQGLPGVQAVGVGSTMPLRSTQFQLDVKAEGRALAAGEAQPHAELRSADPGYFRAAGIPLVAGRDFVATDRDSAARVVVVNKTLAEKFWPGRDPIGQRVAWTGPVLQFIGMKEDQWMTVVGVVADTRDGGLDAEPRNVVFQPFAQTPVFQGGGLVVRTGSVAANLAPNVMRVVRAVAPREPIEHVLTVGQIREESVAPRRLNAALVSSFGILAVIIAAVGIAGVLAFSVSARTTEIGIRMSLGATRSAVHRMVLGEGGVLLVVGLVLGVVGALVVTRLMAGLLFGVSPYDPVTLSVVAVVMAAVGVAACWLPARRAAAIHPTIAIRGR